MKEGGIMRPWTPKDLALAGVGNLLTAALTFALIPVMGNLRPISPWLYLGALLALPLAGSAVTAFLLKRRGVRLWGAVCVLGLFLIALFLMAQALTPVTKFVSYITGHYNSEAMAFSLLFAMVYCGGLLAGALPGWLADWIVRRMRG